MNEVIAHKINLAENQLNFLKMYYSITCDDMIVKFENALTKYVKFHSSTKIGICRILYINENKI